jgi:hypothetical protein
MKGISLRQKDIFNKEIKEIKRNYFEKDIK